MFGLAHLESRFGEAREIDVWPVCSILLGREGYAAFSGAAKKGSGMHTDIILTHCRQRWITGKYNDTE
jgi:hypothetical protein